MKRKRVKGLNLSESLDTECSAACFFYSNAFENSANCGSIVKLGPDGGTGRRVGLKIQYSQGCESSILSLGTKNFAPREI